MPFSGNVYTPPTGAENAAPGQVLQSAIWNAIFTDIAAALTQTETQINTAPTYANILYANGSFNVWQRGAGSSASFSVNASTTAYTADRWYITTGANQASTITPAVALDVSLALAHAVKIVRNSGQTGVTSMTFGYPLSSNELVSINGQKVSFSGAVKAGTGWSPTSGTLNINLYVGTGAPGKRGGGFTNETNPLSISVNVAAGATNSSITGTSTGTVAATSTQGELQVTWTPTGTAGSDDSITLDAFCLVPGSIPQSFTNIPFRECLLQCKRFYQKSFPYGVAPAQNAGLPGAIAVVSQAAAAIGFYVNFEAVEMSATASFTSYNPSAATANWLNTSVSVSVTAAFDSSAASAKGVLLNGGTTSAGVTYMIHYSADAGL